MKTLVEMLDAWGTGDDQGETDEEIRSGLVGVFQEWLGQPEIVPLMYDAIVGDPGRMLSRIQGALRREAGRGLGS
jgi:hypothetical protein